jgi:hypothetical protein
MGDSNREPDKSDLPVNNYNAKQRFLSSKNSRLPPASLYSASYKKVMNDDIRAERMEKPSERNYISAQRSGSELFLLYTNWRN